MTHKNETPRYIMVGGFLGAGKTTSVLRLAEWLNRQTLRVGLISNDQANGLVDTQRMSAGGHAVEEISGGCFCCRFDSLKSAADQLTENVRPDVFIAEPVGSCTDLVATVSYPLRRMYGKHYTIAPLTVVLDPSRAARMLNLKPAGFSENIRYIYLRQIEEASILLINKIDDADPDQLDVLEEALTHVNPRATILRVSATTGEGMEAWYALITSEVQSMDYNMEVDYGIYADGEARLGWCNLTASASRPIEDIDSTLHYLASRIQSTLESERTEIAHLKMTFISSDEPDALASVSVVDNINQPALTHHLHGSVQSGRLTINLRAESVPDRLQELCTSLLAADWEMEHIEAFAPAAPVPVHRDQAPAAAS